MTDNVTSGKDIEIALHQILSALSSQVNYYFALKMLSALSCEVNYYGDLPLKVIISPRQTVTH